MEEKRREPCPCTYLMVKMERLDWATIFALYIVQNIMRAVLFMPSAYINKNLYAQ